MPKGAAVAVSARGACLPFWGLLVQVCGRKERKERKGKGYLAVPVQVICAESQVRKDVPSKTRPPFLVNGPVQLLHYLASEGMAESVRP
eukprot:scaffold63220_cov22-Tisochrysis_lutea.AAC.3